MQSAIPFQTGGNHRRISWLELRHELISYCCAGPKFSYAGDLEKLGSSARERGEATKLRVLDAMRPGEWYASSDLARTLNLNKATVYRHLQTLIEDDKVSDNDANGRACRYWRIVADTGNVK